MSNFIKPIALSLLLGASALTLSACGQVFHTTYSERVPAAEAKQWRTADVRVVVPENLVVNEVNTFMPVGDIVWHGDNDGDRKAQTAKILENALRAATKDLRGKRPVVLTATLKRFHSITHKTYLLAPAGTGVHSVQFDLSVTDARSGAVLYGPVPFETSLPAKTAKELGLTDGVIPATTWKREITSHIAATVRSWLGTGPDNRGEFRRMGS